MQKLGMIGEIVDGIVKLAGLFQGRGKGQIKIEKHYIENPENKQKMKDLESTVQQLQKELAEAKQLGQKMKDPKKYKEFRKEAF